MEQQKKLNKMQEELMRDLGMDGLSEEQQQELIVKMTEAVLKRIFLETLEKLSEEDKKTYEEMIEKQEDPGKLENFLAEKIPNYDKMVAKIVTDFKEEIKTDLKK